MTRVTTGQGLPHGPAEVILDESDDWSFDDGTFEVIGVDLVVEDEVKP